MLCPGGRGISLPIAIMTIDEISHFVNSHMTTPPAPHQESGGRLPRAERLLDVAADLLLRWGYRRITMDDIAAQAAIGKGTIYLHWKTREDLFRAVLHREAAATFADVLATIRRWGVDREMTAALVSRYGESTRVEARFSVSIVSRREAERPNDNHVQPCL